MCVNDADKAHNIHNSGNVKRLSSHKGYKIHSSDILKRMAKAQNVSIGHCAFAAIASDKYSKVTEDK